LATTLKKTSVYVLIGYYVKKNSLDVLLGCYV
jgi:hypothetical protein